MKKKITILAVLVLSVFATASYVSGTYAKYTTTKESSDSARVAKWGFGTATVTELDLFDGTYTNVASGDTDNVIAPGTTKEQEITLTAPTAKSEVAYKLDVTLDGTITDTLSSHLVWKLNGAVAGTTGTFAELKTAVAALSESKIEAGADPTLTGLTISWEWPFEEGADDTAKKANDVLDTELGSTGTATAEVKLSITATQLD